MNFSKAFALALTLAAIQASAGEASRLNGLIALENFSLKVELLDPEVAVDALDISPRFSGGAWIRSFEVKGAAKGSLVSKPVFKGHPSFGLPEEFLPSVKLRDIDGKDSEHLKIGVGKVVRHGASIYSDSAEELFKWTVSTSAAAGLAKASFRQAGRAGDFGYDLEKTASLDDSEPGLLKISGILRNTGEKPLSGEVYLHPFLPFEGSFSCWFAVAAAAPARPSDIPLESRRSIEVAKPHASYEVVAQEAYPKGSWLVAGGDGRDGVFAIRPEGAPWLKIRFWRMDGVYAAEPFLAFSVAPGESFSWSWTVFAAAK